ncbi:MAG: Mrp/NBP35 family ATP-binding protein [candidate division WOR-3 bacterium]|nr:Mrp/NBP35 family ATP-binding protein [candidate division WOR-3 bacterium]MDH5684913.1 Mrp/NBP35 family ATP-binding protein [candidate division WOR-3 bacterium]
MDPRLAIIDNRLKNIKRLIAVSGGKGGIGKSSVAAISALILSNLGYKVGLLDLDFSGPSTHIILGIKGAHPEEEKGILPPEIYGIRFMSIIYYAGENPSPMRGIDISNAIIELLANTLWGSLDFLIIDMPPGIGDTTLDIIRLIKQVRCLILTTSSRVVLATVKKMLLMLKESKIPIIGLIENMKMERSSLVKEQTKALNMTFLGEIAFDRTLEDSTGDVNKFLNTNFAQAMREIILTSSAFTEFQK